MRVIQYSREVREISENGRHTGCPAVARHDRWVRIPTDYGLQRLWFREGLNASLALRTLPMGPPLPKYYPIKQPLEIKTSLSDLIALAWENGGTVADFIIPGDGEQALRVRFDKTHIVRILDEMPLSTESDSKSEGLVSEHFAYFVEDSLFWKSQSEAFKIVFDKARHYRFITGWTCLDVISDAEPSISVIIPKRARS
jgi:hypothetical protein